MNIAHLLRRSALLYAHRPALLHGDQVLWSYGMLAARTAALAAHLCTRCGVAPGDRVGVIAHNRLEAVPSEKSGMAVTFGYCLSLRSRAKAA